MKFKVSTLGDETAAIMALAWAHRLEYLFQCQQEGLLSNPACKAMVLAQYVEQPAFARIMEGARQTPLPRGHTLWTSGEAGRDRRVQISFNANLVKWRLTRTNQGDLACHRPGTVEGGGSARCADRGRTSSST